MFDTNDDNIEQIGKKAAEQFFDESLIPSWNQLEERLNIELPVKKKRRRVFAFWIFFLGLLGSFLYIGFEGSISKKPTKHNLAETTAPAKQNARENESVASVIRHTDGMDSQNTKINLLTQSGHDSYIDNLRSKEKLHQFSGHLSTQINLELDNTNIGNKPVNTKKGLNEPKFQTEKLVIEKAEIENSFSDSPINAKANSIKLVKKDTIETVMVSVENGNTLAKTIISDSLIYNKEKIDCSSPNIFTEAAKKHNSELGFTIAAVAGSNINSVSFNKSSKAGIDYGFLVGYKLSQKFEIKTGITFSRKYFTTTGNNISFDSAKLNLPSYNNIKLEDATGYCRFVEIPVMLYYSFPLKSKTNFYAGTGFSINKMRMEKIHYTFLVNSNTLIERTHAGAYHSADGYSTSVTSNFSFGLKQTISKRWSFAFEPYVKIPLTKVNDSNLKLTTFGASASLILNLPTKKKK